MAWSQFLAPAFYELSEEIVHAYGGKMRSARIREWRAAAGLSQYVDLFEHNRIGLDVLPDLT
jgi:hypothetical protein